MFFKRGLKFNTTVHIKYVGKKRKGNRLKGTCPPRQISTRRETPLNELHPVQGTLKERP